MRVLIVNTSEKTGGAAVAANRLKDALNQNGVKAKMLVRDKTTDDITVVSMKQGIVSQWHLLWERWCIFRHLRFSRKHLFEIDIANAGTDITKLREFQEADIIHLSWINQGMLSLGSIRKILNSGKPVVWTMHDLWPASSICHYAHGCDGFRKDCGHCPLLPNGGSTNDLSAKVFRQKKAVLKNHSIWFVACSQWLAGQARKSSLLTDQFVTNIPNPIDTHFFCPQNKKEARTRIGLPTDRRIILFVSQRVTDKRKGMDYFIDAVGKFAEQHPEWKNSTGIAILGGHSEELEHQLALPVYPIGYVSDPKKIRDVYNSADAFVLPSLEDNLPNTIMESMACGIPCVGFRVGGIPEMIDHRVNGYVAAEKDADDLAVGIHWVLDAENYERLSAAAVSKVLRCYSRHSVAMKYIEVYNQAMAIKNYQL
ncbi:glycosyltransferase family 4 protein [Prevotella sp. HUN102]|uniref:glycosyltransferase family 4 protein n=1 Tax=Prevotella sp. HUN102 TaxID=1392486 RepID=UPI00048CE178|nr:glycosyltransferase family 4 protein [Prevotella sp. HUN102]